MNLPGAFPTATFSSEVACFPASFATTLSKATVLTNAFAPNKPGKQHALACKFAWKSLLESQWIMYILVFHFICLEAKNGQGIPHHRNCLNCYQHWLNFQQVASLQGNHLKNSVVPSSTLDPAPHMLHVMSFLGVKLQVNDHSVSAK